MFGNRLNSLRKAKGFTAQRMADLLSITLSAYRMYENNSRQPSIDRLKNIADILEVPTDYLLERDLSLLKAFDESL